MSGSTFLGVYRLSDGSYYYCYYYRKANVGIAFGPFHPAGNKPMGPFIDCPATSPEEATLRLAEKIGMGEWTNL